jgi:hypothetical protein
MATFPDQLTVTRNGDSTIILDATNADVTLGGHGQDGLLRLLDGGGRRIMSVDVANADFKMGGLGKDGDITLFPSAATDITTPAQATIHLDGESGDIKLKNADAAEDFDVADAQDLEPGDVVVAGEDAPHCVERSRRPYDSRVVGVVAGAGDHPPGIILGRDVSRDGRVPIALIGLVWTKTDATAGSIAVGDLLTTSTCPGYAMRVQDPQRAFGAVLGKAMGRLEDGRGLLPVLVALQ